MKLIKVTLLLAIAALMVAGAPAQTKKAAKKSPGVCSVCKMPFSAKKDKMHTVAVYKGKSVAYCCAGCKMPASMTTKPAKKMKAAKKPAK